MKISFRKVHKFVFKRFVYLFLFIIILVTVLFIVFIGFYQTLKESEIEGGIQGSSFQKKFNRIYKVVQQNKTETEFTEQVKDLFNPR